MSSSKSCNLCLRVMTSCRSGDRSDTPSTCVRMLYVTKVCNSLQVANILIIIELCRNYRSNVTEAKVEFSERFVTENERIKCCK